ncbi:MobQ family relaxase [Pseudosulfitobacter sp. DSM 107133]|uniref:MobQ family relaxase n=1 Tax=Pseudosulfitobacter sp. DSM 107133 TaxID=2883100 RepID=UPI000DF3C520|nr:MobQ family relaxase [Pseudosulfitobacter sp. DSM 107133]
MAIYHLRASMISRSQGRSATAAIAYRVAERIEDRRTGLTFDYAARGGVDHTEILAPDHAPDWVRDRSELWNRVEESETRKNSQVAREVRVALPAELTHAQRVELVRDFAQEQFVDRGMIADIALHAPGRDGDDRNHHAHILLTTREIGPEGFTTKNRDWNKVEVLEGWREAWARDNNIALERAGIEDRVDHRTLEAQRDEALELASAARERGDEGAELVQTVRAIELDRPPLPQLSPGAWQMKERGIEVGRVGAWHEAKARAEVGRVGAWHEAKARAAEVMEVARELAGHVRDWLDRAADRVLDRLGPEQSELALAGGREGREQEPDFATRLQAAWEARKEGRERHEAETPEREAPDDFAARLRAAAAGIDREALSDRVFTLREGREADERQAELDAAQERERTKELELEREVHARRDRGHDYGL